jgi:hypothetical protein
MSVFVTKGDKPLTETQLHKRTQAYIKRDMPAWVRERAVRTGDTDLLNAYMAEVEQDTDLNRGINEWNIILWAYVDALAVLAKPTPDVPATITVTMTVTSDAGETVEESEVENPVLLEFASAQADAQSTVDAAPQGVKDYYDENIAPKPEPEPDLLGELDGLPVEG